MVTIGGQERVFIAGKTGSGKTYLARNLLAPVPRLVLVDLKGTLTDWQTEPDSRQALDRLAHGRPVRVRLRDEETALAYLGSAYQAGGCIVFIDEVYALVPPGTRVPNELTAIWTRGRELGIGGWAATQRPTWVPLFVMSEADHFFCFRMNLEEDRKRMAGFMGEEVEEPITDKHGFYYMRADGDNPARFARLNGSIGLLQEA